MRRIVTSVLITALTAAAGWAWRNRARLAAGIEATLETQSEQQTDLPTG